MTDIQVLPHGKYWYDTTPKEAAELYAGGIPDECAPMNEMDDFCPWPWEPEQLVGVPLGQFHCQYCGGMQMAGMQHLDHRGVVYPEPTDDDGTRPGEGEEVF